MFENLKGLSVKKTLWLNILRSMCAGVVWMIISFFLPAAGVEETPFYIKLLFPVVLPVLVLFAYLLTVVLKIFKLGGIGNIMTMLLTVPGDPLLFILFKSVPGIVPVESLSFFNFSGLILVYNNVVPNFKSSSTTNENGDSCPFVGRIIVDTEIQVLGMNWPSQSTIFTIKDDWKVDSKKSSFGWIDKNGVIHKGIPETDFNGKVNYHTIFSGGVVGEIKHDGLYVDVKKVGKLSKW
ncbi:MAG: hypothetical protein PF541_15285 [Prolixibacteraceae bacterium]|jgi:hypothetical protein|nr:hypothetical protein [Prolixibacteraceae bacterium]